MFIDPAGQYRFELPLGWAYDPEQSHLITVIFKHWKYPKETLSVRAIPTFTSPDTRDQEWYKVLEERCFPPQMRPITQMKCGSMAAALAEIHETEPEKIHRRILVVRGILIDIVAEHRVPGSSTDYRLLSEVLSTVCRSLQVPTNWFLPELGKQEEVESDLEQALEALQRQSRDEALTLLLRAQRAAQSTYLYSLVHNAFLPEIPAIIALIDALVYMALVQTTMSLLHLRDAEHLTLRALYTLRLLPLAPYRMQQLDRDITERLRAIIDLQITVAKEEWTQLYPPSAGFGLSMLRVDPLLKQAWQIWLEGQPTLALKPCETGIADLMIVLSFINTLNTVEISGLSIDFAELPQYLAEKLESAGATTFAQKIELIQQLSQQFSHEMLKSINLLFLISDMKAFFGDVVGAKEAVEFVVEITQDELKKLPSLESRNRRLAAALIQLANRLVEMGDEQSLEEAQANLDKAREQLDELGEESTLRAWLCLIQASLLHSQHIVKDAAEIIDRGLRAAAAEIQHSQQYVKELKTIQSQFLMHEGRLQEARDVALEVINFPEGSDPRDHLDRSAHYLNLAIIDSKLGNLQESAVNLCAALYRVLAVSPFGEVALRVLKVASNLYIENNFPLSYQLNLAAAVILDARRVIIGADKFRINFDEATLRRQTYEGLIEPLLKFCMAKEAVAVADRSRARSLNELLAIPNSKPDGFLPSLLTPPPLDSTNVEQSLLKAAEYIIQNASIVLYQHRAIPPLHADEIEALAQNIGAPTLVIQPVKSQVALLLVQSTGQVEVQFSSLSLDELLELVNNVQSQFRIFSVPRGESENEASISLNENFNEILARLWNALIEPIKEFLTVGKPLVIVPYREFTLIPFALLLNPEGHLLLENHAISVVPSLATLRLLRDRGVWARTCPFKAYIIGDPATSRKTRMKRLPAARIEAETVAKILKAAGLPEEEITLRLDNAASEESYRTEARGCDLVHLSCHARLEEPAYESRLYLAPDNQHDGLLLVSEIAEVKLNDALVFLAACETGQGRPTADSIIGIGRAFLEAGARTVILSLWKVEDAATAALTRCFYQTLLQTDTPYNVSEALRIAMLSTRAQLEAGKILTKDQQPLEAHPLNWASFFVLGDGLSIFYQL